MTPREWLDTASELERLVSDVREHPDFPGCLAALLEQTESLVAEIREQFASELS